MQTEKNKRGRPRKWGVEYLKRISEICPEYGKRHLSNYAYAMISWRDIYNTIYETAFCDKAKNRIKISLLCELGKIKDEKIRNFLIQWIYESSLKEKINVKKASFVVRNIYKNPHLIDILLEADS